MFAITAPTPLRAGTEAPHKTPAVPVLVNTLPDTAEVVFHFVGDFYAMDASGGDVVRLTHFGPNPALQWEHVAISHDRRYLVANQQTPLTSVPGGVSALWLIDLSQKTMARLVPEFVSAGNGGVSWDRRGRIYFAGHPPVLAPPGPIEPTFPPPVEEAVNDQSVGPNDLFRIRPDGTGLEQLVATPDRGEADIGVSEDGSTIAWVSQKPPDDVTELWTARSDGSRARLLYRSGLVGIASAHDPEPSPDGSRFAFSVVNSSVPPNFPVQANTAHDIHIINADGTGLRRLTRPGPISIVPNWRLDGRIVFLVLSDEETDYLGASIIDADGPADQTPLRIHHDASTPKWVPPADG